MKFIVLFGLLVCASAIIHGGRGRFASSSSSDSHEHHHGRHSHSYSHSHEHYRPPRGPSRPRTTAPPPPPPAGCPTNWREFSRPSGPWCIGVFPAAVDQPEAQRQCATQGGVLSGIQNYQELNFMTSEALKHVASGAIWIGAQRTEACRSQKLTASCTRTNSFQWTDGSATGIEGFVWNSGQPDNAWNNIQSCILLLASSSPTIRARDYTFERNTLDDVQCVGLQSIIAPTPRAVYGYACGKKPM